MLISAEFFEAEHRQNLLNHNKLSILILIGGCALHAITGGAIGMGDIKLFAVLSLLLPGFQAVLLAITFSTICGLLQSLLQRARAIPFAPGLLTGTLLVILLR
jgi:prepilin signal peptidase PulO-like enzyme (type II secretory pathway)